MHEIWVAFRPFMIDELSLRVCGSRPSMLAERSIPENMTSSHIGILFNPQGGRWDGGYVSTAPFAVLKV